MSEISEPQTEAHAQRLLAAAGALSDIVAVREPSRTEIERTMDQAFGAGANARAWSGRDADEAIEIAITQVLLESGPARYAPMASSIDMLTHTIEVLASHAPTQRTRSREQTLHQHFSTPLGIAWAMAEAAEIAPGERVLEPSAGLGALIGCAHAQAPEAQWHVNEIEPVRYHVLKALLPQATVTCADATALDADGFDVVLMNPPFSADAGTRRKRPGEDARHVAQATARLRPGGRLVTVTGAYTLPGERTWDRAFNALGAESLFGTPVQATLIWSNLVDSTLYHAKGTSVQTRVSVVERDSAYADRPFKPCHDARCESALDLLCSVMTSLGGRVGPNERHL